MFSIAAQALCGDVHKKPQGDLAIETKSVIAFMKASGI
jgi:hypothetical protein